MKYLKDFNKYRDQEVNEKWYHNLLAGLMLLSPTLSTYANTNTTIPKEDKIEMSSEKDAISAINAMINYINTNRDEFKDGTYMAGQLNKLLHQYKRGEIDANSMNKIAKDFYQNAKNSDNPVIHTSKTAKEGFVKVGEIHSFKELIKAESPSQITVDFFEDTFFESGSFKIGEDNIAIKNISDSLASLNKEGYKVVNVNIESSTDGQGLSTNLQKTLEDGGYSKDNAGLSKARNNEMKKMLTTISDINDNQISQEINFENDGEENESLRYNKISLEFVKTESGDIQPEEEVVYVFYKMSDKQERQDVNALKRNKVKKNKKKSNKKTANISNSVKCFSFG